VASLRTRQELGDTSGIAQCLEAIAAVGLACHQPEQAARLFGAAATLREAIDLPLSPTEHVGFDRELAAARAEIGDDAFAAIWAEGWALPIDRAVERALALAGSAADAEPAPVQRSDAGRASSLTPREREVAALIARGLTNRQIAAELIVAERTVDTHVRNVLGKLNLISRAQVAAWAARQGLIEGTPT
jgi:non-specific serine/threonine protein kinase